MNERPAARPLTDDALAAQAGADWAHARAAELRNAGRPVVGGWPGTMREAMTHVLAALGPRDADDLRRLARTTYGSARTTWLAVSERDDEL